MNRLGATLRAYRVSAGLTQTAVARAACIDPSYVNRLEARKQDLPARPIIARLAQALALDDRDAVRLFVAAGYWPSDDPTFTDALLAVADALIAAGVAPRWAPPE